MKLENLKHDTIMNMMYIDTDGIALDILLKNDYKDFEKRLLWNTFWTLKRNNGEMYKDLYDKYDCNDSHIETLMRVVFKEMKIPTNEDFYKSNFMFKLEK